MNVSSDPTSVLVKWHLSPSNGFISRVHKLDRRQTDRPRHKCIAINRIVCARAMPPKTFSNAKAACLTTGKNLFQRAIVQSGSALSSWGLATSPRGYAQRLAAAVNCTSTSTTASEQSADYIRCFKGLPAETLVDAEVPGMPDRYLSALGPTVDRRTVLPSGVRSLTRRRNVDSVFARTPVLLGITRDEGQIFLAQSDLDQVWTTVSRNFL